MLYVRFFVYGCLTFGTLYYIMEGGALSVRFSLIGGLAFLIATGCATALNAVYAELMKS